MAYPTNPIYKLFKNIDRIETGVLKEENGCKYTIPLAPENTDYQEYLAWVAEGNTPEPADE